MFELQRRAEVILGLGALGLVVNILVLELSLFDGQFFHFAENISTSVT
ncbi:MAG: hypothetical protein H0X02_13665 [Nitrosomonas sp.]|nr:hypothetical protein [Nitrosomonas sp.]